MSASLKNKRVTKKSKDQKRVDEYHFNITKYASCVLGVEDKGRNIDRELGAILEELPISLSLNPSLTFPSGENMVQAIQDWLISKSSFEEKSFHGLTIFYRKYIKDLGTIASYLMDVPKKKTGFPWKICLHLNEIASNQAPYSTTLYSFLEVDYGFKLLTSFDLILFSIGHILCLDEKENMMLIKYIHSKKLNDIEANNMTFGMQCLVFDPKGLGWGYLGFE
ncbi:hypothetical protein M9H77_02918 [Catharanthus roseus]|uniref:Uncharacterized protein n=1 Tax=Catharanthus roseus TaxID=4058 RepID=A0ACC0C9Y8_CATRO|nr:hypothetical protein M9H77_02918 [Catharanthus roseus]